MVGDKRESDAARCGRVAGNVEAMEQVPVWSEAGDGKEKDAMRPTGFVPSVSDVEMKELVDEDAAELAVEMVRRMKEEAKEDAKQARKLKKKKRRSAGSAGARQ